MNSTKTRCPSCNSCGMPLDKKEDFALGNPSSPYCQYCVDTSGKLLPYETILKNNTDYLKESQGLTDQAALRMAQNLLREQPAWKNAGA
jgi:hypothetical protein